MIASAVEAATGEGGGRPRAAPPEVGRLYPLTARQLRRRWSRERRTRVGAGLLLTVPLLTGWVTMTANSAAAQAGPSESTASSTTTEPPEQPTTPASEPAAADTAPAASQESGDGPAGEDPQRVSADDLMNDILRRALEPASSVPAATATGPSGSGGSDAWPLAAVAVVAAGGAVTILCARRIRRRRRPAATGGEGVDEGASTVAALSGATATVGALSTTGGEEVAAGVGEVAQVPEALAPVEVPAITATRLDRDHGNGVDGANAIGPPPPGPGDVGVWVAVLGPVEVTGLPDALGDRHKLTEVLVYLATHGERSVRGGALMCACWPDRDIASTTFNSAMSRLRRHLGTASSGERRLPADGGTYRLGPDVGCDWTSFRSLVARAKGAEPSVAVSDYREALKLVHGEPFAAVGRGTYSWAWSEQLVYEMDRVVVQAAVAMGELALSEGDTETARWAAVQGRAASPFEPLLFEIQVRAAELAGDEGELARVREAADNARRSLTLPSG